MPKYLGISEEISAENIVVVKKNDKKAVKNNPEEVKELPEIAIKRGISPIFNLLLLVMSLKPEFLEEYERGLERY